MAEVTVSPSAKETIITLGDGTVVSATISEETLSVVSEKGDPVVVALNSGPRGQPGSSILVGTGYPLMSQGSVGDIFLSTGGVNVGAVFKKTETAWVEEGNVRGPAGGIESVNGDFGPGVILDAADIGLSEVDNTADLDKPVSTAQQEALNLKANASDTVNLTGAQTIAGVKTFSSAPVVPDASWAIAKTNGLQTILDNAVTLTTNQTITGAKIFSQSLVAPAMTLAASVGNSFIEMGRVDGVSSSPYIDFHSGATATDYDARISVLGGTGASGGGGITITAATVGFTGVISGNGSGITTLNGSNVSSGTVADARLSTNVSLLNVTQTYTGQKSFTATDTFIARWTANSSWINSITNWTLGSAAGDVQITRRHTHSGNTNQFHLIDMMHRRAASSADWVTTQWYQGIGVDASFAESPTTGATSRLRAWIKRDPQFEIVAFGSSGTEYLSLSATAASFAGSIVINGNGSGLTNLNGSNIGTGTVPDARLSTNVAMKSYVDAIVNGAPGALDTLNELAAALGNDANFATTMTNQLALKAPLASPAFTGTVTGITKAMVGLGNVDNTADTAKPVSTAQQTALNGKENTIAAGTTAQYWRGDKSWQTLNAAAAGLGNVANLAQVDLVNAQTIAGIKTFSATPVFSTGISVTGTVTATTLSGALAATNLTGTILQARLVQNTQRFEFTVASTARPTGSTYVEWVGPSQPTNMIAGDSWFNTSASGNTSDAFPSGMVVASASAKTASATGWYWIEGQQVLISGDTSLYNEITNNATVFPYGANTNGAGAAGSTHFRLPNAAGKVIAHVDGTTEFAAIGAVFGAKSVALSIPNLPPHTHGVNDPGHYHALYGRTWYWGAVATEVSDIYFNVTANGGDPAAVSNLLESGSTAGVTAPIGTGISTQSVGSGTAHNNVQPTLTMRYMIKR